MAEVESEKSALGIARLRFVDGLEKKGAELRLLLDELESGKAADRARDEARRRLHTLYASAQVFRMNALAEALRRSIARLDDARDRMRALDSHDLASFRELIESMQSLAAGDTATSVRPSGIASLGPSSMSPTIVRAPEDFKPISLPVEQAQVTVPQVEPPANMESAHAAEAATSEIELEPEATQAFVEVDAERRSEFVPTHLAEVLSPNAPLNRVQIDVAPDSAAPGMHSLDGANSFLPTHRAAPTSAKVSGLAHAPVPHELAYLAKQLQQAEAEPSGPVIEQSLPPKPLSPQRHMQTLAPLADALRRDQGPTTLVPTGAEHPSIPPATITKPAPRQPQTVRPSAPITRVVSVLLVDSPESLVHIRSILPVETHELIHAVSVDAALRLAHSSTPDLVLIDAELVANTSVDFVARLRSDPLTDSVPVVALIGANTRFGADEITYSRVDATQPKPSELRELQALIARLVHHDSAGSVLRDLGDASVEQVAEHMSNEIRHALVDRVVDGKETLVALADGAEVLAATWAAIARVRAHLTAKSSGKVRFRDLADRGGPAWLAFVDDKNFIPEEPADISLRGKRILVVDDDPSIVAFFAGVLRQQGADVIEVGHGGEALRELRSRRVDLVISDVVMPEVDGFALAREMHRDPSLAHVPLIMLSWKEDLLQRMRELEVQASAYLRKESAATQIVASVADALRPLVWLEDQLRADGEIRGAVDRVGMITLIRTVAELRPTSRITVRDAWNLYELQFRDGAPVDLSRTATDGSFMRGVPALVPMLGANAGRFTVTSASTALPRASLNIPLETLLREATMHLGARVDAVSGTSLIRATRIEFDGDITTTLLANSPASTRRLVARLREVGSPKHLLDAGEVSPQSLESALVDLARRCAIRAVFDGNGDDLIAEALRARRAVPVVPDFTAKRLRRTSAPPPYVAQATAPAPAAAPPPASTTSPGMPVVAVPAPAQSIATHELSPEPTQSIDVAEVISEPTQSIDIAEVISEPTQSIDLAALQADEEPATTQFELPAAQEKSPAVETIAHEEVAEASTERALEEPAEEASASAEETAAPVEMDFVAPPREPFLRRVFTPGFVLFLAGFGAAGYGLYRAADTMWAESNTAAAAAHVAGKQTKSASTKAPEKMVAVAPVAAIPAPQPEPPKTPEIEANPQVADETTALLLAKPEEAEAVEVKPVAAPAVVAAAAPVVPGIDVPELWATTVRDVKIDGRSVGAPPLHLDIAPGHHEVTLEYVDGVGYAYRIVDVSAGTRVTIGAE